ncbi:MAG: hypothetical protein ACE5ES_00910 [Candidatus Nanoarchaeia archaeon]
MIDVIFNLEKKGEMAFNRAQILLSLLKESHFIDFEKGVLRGFYKWVVGIYQMIEQSCLEWLKSGFVRKIRVGLTNISESGKDQI